MEKEIKKSEGNYQDRISNYKLNDNEKYCLGCEKVIKTSNLKRHDVSFNHKKKINGK